MSQSQTRFLQLFPNRHWEIAENNQVIKWSFVENVVISESTCIGRVVSSICKRMTIVVNFMSSKTKFVDGGIFRV